MASSQDRLPRLLYVAEVPVESSYHGSALLYRLLAGYPTDRLLVVEMDDSSRPDRRLPGVDYRFLPARLVALRRRWLSNLRLGLLLGGAPHPRPRPELVRLAKEFGAEAVVTVTHGPSWLEAAQLADAAGLPLHLVCHDDWVRSIAAPPSLTGRAEAVFGQRYRQAASRMCVSPAMAERYGRDFGGDAVVLYPARAPDAKAQTVPPARVCNPTGPFTVAFAGSLHSYMLTACQEVAQLIAPHGGRLQVYGPLEAAPGRSQGLTAENVEFCGLLPSNQLIDRLAEEADVLFCPMPFEDSQSDFVAYSFPSKLTDYTAAGLPILLQAPAASAAHLWAQQNPGVAMVVDDPSTDSLRQALDRLRTDADLRQKLAGRAIEVGAKIFSASAANQLWLAQIAGRAGQ